MTAKPERVPLKRRLRSALKFYRLWLSRHSEDTHILTTGRPPVILLCGWGSSRNTFEVLERRLKEDGFAPFAFPLGGLLGHFNTQAIETLSEHLDVYFASMTLAFGLPRMAIVGHSIGGIIGRHFVCSREGNKFVHTLITLGSPHRGSHKAEIALHTPLKWISQSLKQIVPGSAFLSMLDGLPPPKDVHCASLYSQADTYCPPPQSKWKTKERSDNVVNIDVGPVTHMEFLLDEGVYEKIREQLKKGLSRKD